MFAAGVLGDEIIATGEPLHVGRSTVVIEVRIERRREGQEPRRAANLIVSQFVLPPDGLTRLSFGASRKSSAS